MTDKNKTISKAELEKALIDAGYGKVTFSPQTIRVLKPGGKPGEVVDQKVFDAIVEGGKVPAFALLDDSTANFMALSVAKKLGLRYRELQTFGEAVILRWCQLGD